MTKNEMLKDYMEYRCGVYFWLKSLYLREPSMEILSGISTTCKEYATLAEFNEQEQAFINFFKSLDEKDVQALHEAIKPEYARLFIGPRRVPVPPYESVYRENRKSIFGRNTMAVREVYQNAGIELGTGLNIPEDFIGFELEFMYYLSFETVKALEADELDKVSKLLSYQQYFLSHHLVKWINEFTQDIVKATTLEYFDVTAKFTAEFIVNDHESLSELIA